jgi:hypothetical protein
LGIHCLWLRGFYRIHETAGKEYRSVPFRVKKEILMDVYKAKEHTLSGVRVHPWRTASYDSACRYYDFKQHPELIPNVLEDFLPWSKYPAIQDFYSYLAWLNGPDSQLESNDCAFGGITDNNSPNRTSSKLQASGRLMVIFRSLAANCEAQCVEWLFKCFWFYLERAEVNLQLGTIGLSKADIDFLDLNRRKGMSLVLNFWSWGDTEFEAMNNLQRLIAGLRSASVEVCTDIQSATNRSF